MLYWNIIYWFQDQRDVQFWVCEWDTSRSFPEVHFKQENSYWLSKGRIISLGRRKHRTEILVSSSNYFSLRIILQHGFPQRTRLCFTSLRWEVWWQRTSMFWAQVAQRVCGASILTVIQKLWRHGPGQNLLQVTLLEQGGCPPVLNFSGILCVLEAKI